MQSAINYFRDYYALASAEEVYSFFKEEIGASSNCYYPNPLLSAPCVHIINKAEHVNQPVVVEGTLDLIAEEELFSTCYPKKPSEGIVW